MDNEHDPTDQDSRTSFLDKGTPSVGGDGNIVEAKSSVARDDLMVAYRVSVRVNAPKNDDAGLIEPADAAPEDEFRLTPPPDRLA